MVLSHLRWTRWKCYRAYIVNKHAACLSVSLAKLYTDSVPKPYLSKFLYLVWEKKISQTKKKNDNSAHSAARISCLEMNVLWNGILIFKENLLNRCFCIAWPYSPHNERYMYMYIGSVFFCWLWVCARGSSPRMKLSVVYKHLTHAYMCCA